MSANNGFQANPDDIRRFEREAANVAGQIPGLMNRYPLHLLQTPFGGANFPAATQITKAYGNLLARMTENVQDLADQATAFGNGASYAASGYSQTADNEVAYTNQFVANSHLTGG